MRALTGCPYSLCSCATGATPRCRTVGQLCDQLRDLIAHANREGMFDAADYLTEVMQRAEERMKVVGT